MTKLYKFALLIFIIVTSHAIGKENFFIEAKSLFDNGKIEESKFLFQRNIVFNPKDSKSYLYLAKIFMKDENIEEEEINLKNVLLLNPKNDEAIYMLVLIKIKQSNYSEADELINKFNLVCKSFCSKKKEIESKLKKLKPENAKNNN